MADEVVPYEENPLNAAIGTGTIYRVLGIVVAIGLVLTLIVGFSTSVSPGLLSDGQAFLIGGLTLVVISAAVLVLLFSLTGSIRYINREMQDLTRLRKAIESSYARLASSTQNLGKEIGELRQSLPAIRKLAAEMQKASKKAERLVPVETTET
jgi:hypothetical protein